MVEIIYTSSDWRFGTQVRLHKKQSHLRLNTHEKRTKKSHSKRNGHSKRHDDEDDETRVRSYSKDRKDKNTRHSKKGKGSDEMKAFCHPHAPPSGPAFTGRKKRSKVHPDLMVVVPSGN